MRQTKVENTKFPSPGGSRRDRHTKYYKTQKTFSDQSSQQQVLQELNNISQILEVNIKNNSGYITNKLILLCFNSHPPL